MKNELMPIIKKLNEKVKECKKYGQEDHEASWNYQEGVLITSGEAKIILHALRALIDFNKHAPESF